MNKKLCILISILVASHVPFVLAASDTEKTLHVDAASTFEFEGATDDAFETIIAVTDPTSSDKTITFPNETGTVLVGPAVDAAGAVDLQASAIVFEGATADAFETTVTVVDPTTPDKTITFGDETGTVYTTAAASKTSAELASTISNETGTGVAVFATTPTLVTPVLGAATGTSIVLSSTFTSTATGALGWTVVAGANTACNTTCTNACVIGMDAGASAFVDCAGATSDSCLCAGGS